VRLLIAVLLCWTPLLSQTTWLELKWGSSIADAEAVLQGHGFKLRDSGDTKVRRFEVYPQFEVSVPGSTTSALLFNPQLIFDAKGLAIVALTLDTKEHLKRTPAFPLTGLGRMAGRRLFEALTGKYGAPLRQTPLCAQQTLDALLRGDACDAGWTSEGQAISLYWTFRSSWKDEPERLTVIVQYKRLADPGL
jgi:hypothetical protein